MIPNIMIGNKGYVEDYTREIEHLQQAYGSLQHKFAALKAELQSSHETLKQIIHHMTDGLLLVAQDGTITLVNPAAAQLVGLEQAFLVGKHFRECFADHFFGFSMEEALKKEGKRKRVFLTLNGRKEIDVSTSSIPEQGVLLLLTNRIERSQLEESVSQSEKLQALGEMAATMAHEIRNPLGGIEGFARLLKRDLQQTSQQKMIEAILEGTGTINHLVNEVLDYARPLQLHFEPVDIVDLIRNLMNQHVCHFETAHASYFLSIDKERIKLVLQNLIRNALEADATKIDIHLTETGTLLIKDNGKGINSENLRRIFTPFFTTKARGTGLGLAQSLSVIQAHGGTLEVESEESKGTLFKIRMQNAH